MMIDTAMAIACISGEKVMWLFVPNVVQWVIQPTYMMIVSSDHGGSIGQ